MSLELQAQAKKKVIDFEPVYKSQKSEDLKPDAKKWKIASKMMLRGRGVRPRSSIPISFFLVSDFEKNHSLPLSHFSIELGL